MMMMIDNTREKYERKLCRQLKRLSLQANAANWCKRYTYVDMTQWGKVILQELVNSFD